jgi:signal peptidase II
MNYKFNYKKALISILGVFFLVLLDQVTKYIAVVNLQNKPNIVLIPGVLELTYLENTGAAFSIMNSASFFQTLMKFLTPVFFIIIIIFLYKFSKKNNNKIIYIDLLIILSGAVGNYIDRINNNFVVDFIYFSLINFPVFNVADIYVTLGFIMLAILILFVYKDNEDKDNEDKDKENH